MWLWAWFWTRSLRGVSVLSGRVGYNLLTSFFVAVEWKTEARNHAHPFLLGFGHTIQCSIHQVQLRVSINIRSFPAQAISIPQDISVSFPRRSVVVIWPHLRVLFSNQRIVKLDDRRESHALDTTNTFLQSLAELSSCDSCTYETLSPPLSWLLIDTECSTPNFAKQVDGS